MCQGLSLNILRRNRQTRELDVTFELNLNDKEGGADH